MSEIPSEKKILKDIDIEIRIRSGETELPILKEIVKVIVTSLQIHMNGKLVTTEIESKTLFQYQKSLYSVRTLLFLE